MKKRLRVTGLCLLVGFLATSCGGVKAPGSEAKVPGARNTTSSGSVQPSSDPREDLKKAFTAQLAATSFRYRLEFSSASGGHTEAEFVAPDRYHVSVIQQLAPGRDIRQEMIIIGKNSFMKIADMPWRKDTDSGQTTMAKTIASTAQQFCGEDVNQRMMKYEDIKFVGPNVLDGQPVLVYQFRLRGARGQTPGKIWISANDSLPRKIEHEGGPAPVPNADGSNNKLTVTYYDYNTNIKIEPPI